MTFKPLALALLSAASLSACMGTMSTHADGNASAMADSAMPANGMPDNPMVGGAAMYASKDIIDNAVNSKDHTTLVAAVKAADLVETLKGKGPFTVFAPVNAAFAALPAGTVDSLLKPENKAQLRKVLTYHVVMGKMDTAALAKAIDAGGGKAMLTAVSGGTLTATKSGSTLMVADDSGAATKVTIPDVVQSNGVIHVVDKVLLPK